MKTKLKRQRKTNASMFTVNIFRLWHGSRIDRNNKKQSKVKTRAKVTEHDKLSH